MIPDEESFPKGDTEEPDKGAPCALESRAGAAAGPDVLLSGPRTSVVSSQQESPLSPEEAEGVGGRLCVALGAPKCCGHDGDRRPRSHTHAPPSLQNAGIRSFPESRPHDKGRGDATTSGQFHGT